MTTNILTKIKKYLWLTGVSVSVLLISILLSIKIGYSGDIIKGVVIGVGLVTGLMMVILFLISPRVPILIFYAIRPSLGSLMEPALISGTSISIALGAPLRAILLLGGILYLLISRTNIFRKPGGLLYPLFLLVTLLSTFNSMDFISALREWGKILSYFIIFAILTNIGTKKEDIPYFLIVLIISLLVPMTVGFYQLVSGTGLYKAGFHRITGTFHIPNEYAAYLIFPLLIGIAFSLDNTLSMIQRSGFAFLALGVALSLFFTYTRASWLGMFIGLMIMGMIRYKSLLFICPLAILILLLFVPLESLRMQEIVTGQGSLYARLHIWERMFPLVISSPVWGHGFTDFDDLAEKFLGRSTVGQSDYFKILVEVGLIGLITFLCLMLRVLRVIYINYRYAEEPRLKDFLLATFGFIVATMIISFFETNAAFRWHVWIPAGIACGIEVNKDKGSLPR